MKIFIGLLIAFTTLISVEADLASDQKALVAAKTAQYAKFTELEIKSHVKINIGAIETLMREAAAQYRLEGIVLVANWYDNIIKFVDEGTAKVWITLDKETDLKERMTNLIKYGVTVEVLRFRGETEKKRRAANPLKVTDTEANLEKKLQDIIGKIMDLTKWTVEELTKKKNLFWADFHQKIYDYLKVGLGSELTASLKNLKTEAIRAKNLQVLNEDLTLFMAVADTRPPATFFQKVSNKFYEFAASVKSTFAKINPFKA